ncbi:MAG: hypothetical protein HY000_33405 [Planctomycetes bacterium]|nr:hypothetical protein [Planctomycetota bacterium]
MRIDKLTNLLNELWKKTHSQVLEWDRVGDAFMVSFPDYAVSVWKDALEPAYKVQIWDKNGNLVDEVTLTEKQHGGQECYIRVAQVFALAGHQLHPKVGEDKVNEAVDTILRELQRVG